MPIDPVSIPEPGDTGPYTPKHNREPDRAMADDYIEKVKAGLPPHLGYDYDPPAIHNKRMEMNHTFERYVRVNVVKNSKGYNTDCTVSVTSTAPQSEIEKEIADLLILAADAAEHEIRRQEIEQMEKETENGS